MNSNGGALRLAVLIDGENVPAKDAGPLFAQVAKLGNPIIRRVYGDFTKANVKDWPKIISDHGGSAHQSGHTSAGKNASDIAMVVDAMDFLHRKSVDGFCIVSEDGDFTSLAKRAREDGFKVYCFGHNKSPAALKAACDGFFLLAEKPPEQAHPVPAVQTTSKPVTVAAAPVKKAASKQKPPAERKPQLARPWIDKALPADRSWMTLSALGQALRAADKGYLKKTGVASLKKLLTAMNDRYEQGIATDGKTAQARRRH
jgi:hypothetical protein